MERAFEGRGLLEAGHSLQRISRQIGRWQRRWEGQKLLMGPRVRRRKHSFTYTVRGKDFVKLIAYQKATVCGYLERERLDRRKVN